MRISDWSSDVCSSDLSLPPRHAQLRQRISRAKLRRGGRTHHRNQRADRHHAPRSTRVARAWRRRPSMIEPMLVLSTGNLTFETCNRWLAQSEHAVFEKGDYGWFGSEEHTSELQSLMRISYAVFCFNK